MRILITNDDGIAAPGLRALYEAIAPHAEVAVVAPARDFTGAGMSITLDLPMQIDPFPWPDEVTAWRVDGTPTDCVRVGLQFLLDYRPDFVLSGVNWGSNAGRNALYSGTVAAALEAGVHGVRGIALSAHYDREDDQPDFRTAARYLPRLLDFLSRANYPTDVTLNVNFPSCEPDEVAGFQMARQGASYWRIVHRPLSTEGESQTVYAGGEHLSFDEPEGSDVLLLRQGFIVAVPLSVPDLTHQGVLSSHGKSFESFFSPC